MIKKTFRVRIDQLQPSQPYLSKARLDNILSNTSFLLRPVAVREMKGRYCIIEGHERCFALYSVGKEEVEVYLDSSDKDQNIWQECVAIARDAGIASITDLEERIVPVAQFKEFWVERKKDLSRNKANKED